jgi:hypothetical protein
MTRINIVPVEELSDQHLLAEHREIKRIPNCILKGRYNLDNIPSKYTMGKGHVKFFYNKLYFLYTRYMELKYECEAREFNVENYQNSFENCMYKFPELDNNWIPTEEDIEISRSRLQQKYDLKPHFYKWTKHIL